MDKVAEKLAALLVREKLVSESMLEIYQYGLVRMLEIGAAVFSGFVICLSMGMIKEGLLFFIFFVPLRSYLGGIHLKKYWQCYIVSCFTLLIVMTLAKMVFLDMRFSAGLFIVTVIGIGIEALKLENKVYSWIVWAVLFVLLVVMGFCIAKEQETVLVLLSCITAIVLVSKVLEQIVQHRQAIKE